MISAKRVYDLIGQKHRKETLFLIFLVLVGAIAETLGLSAIIPLLTFISKPEAINSYPEISNFLIEYSPGNLVFLASFDFSENFVNFQKI